jgi:hypothetical protein
MKTITDSLVNHLLPQSSHPQLTQFPAYDYVNPGIAQTSRLYSFYVPLFSKTSDHLITKVSNIEQLGSGVHSNEAEQLGSGIASKSAVVNGIDTESVVANESDPSKSSFPKLSDKEVPLNSGIKDSFLHPHFNFGTIKFGTGQKTKDLALTLPQKRKLNTVEKKISTKKHKFEVY